MARRETKCRAALLLLLALAAAAACLVYLAEVRASASGLPGVASAAAARRRSLAADGGDDDGSKAGSSKGRGGSKAGKGGKAPPPPSPCPSLWSIAKKADDLQFLTAVHRHTSLHFFSPFAKGSGKRPFTLLAPTDAAWNATFGAASADEQSALRSGLPALLLYHQILTAGYSAQQLAARYEAPTALGPSIGKEMKVDMDKVGEELWASGQAPNNYARVVREHESCGAHLIVVDAVLQPLGVGQLPQLQTEQPINDTTWAKLMATIDVESQLALGSPAELPLAAPAPAPAPAWADGAPAAAAAAPAAAAAADSAAGSPAASVGSSSVSDGGGGSGASEVAAAGTPAQEQPPQQPAQPAQGGNVWEIEPAPPAPPGVPPDCATLAATGQLMRTDNGSLTTDHCHPSVATAVLSSGGTQTVVSDARQKANSLLVAAAVPAPGPPASAAARLLGSGWVAAMLATTLTALWLDPLRVGRLV